MNHAPGFIAAFILFHVSWRSESHLYIGRQSYIVHVTSECPDDDAGLAVVTVLTDVIGAHPFGICRGDVTYNFTKEDLGVWTLYIHLQDNVDSIGQCVFNKLDGGNTYVINVFSPLNGDVVVYDNIPYVITCSYDAKQLESSRAQDFPDGNRPLQGILVNVGNKTASKIKLEIIDVSGKKISGRLRVGRSVRLRAKLLGNDTKEVGIQPIQCEAVGRSKSYTILISGCGDGTILSKSGFNTIGRVSVSAYFKTFRMPGTQNIDFRCTFLICDEVCDGSSCSNLQPAT